MSLNHNSHFAARAVSKHAGQCNPVSERLVMFFMPLYLEKDR